MSFIKHGEFAIHVDRRVVRVDAHGPWNLECTAEYCKQLRNQIAPMPASFAMLAISHEQSILSPEAEAILRNNVRWRVAHGCVAQATVLLDSSETCVAPMRYVSIYLPEGLPHRIFSSVAEAGQWLAGCGFPEAVAIAGTEIFERSRVA